MPTYTIDDGDGGAALDENQQHLRGDGVGVIDPGGGDLAVSINTGALGSNDTLTVDSGDAYIQGTTYSLGSQSIGINGANSTDPRIDVVYVDTGGSLQVKAGTPESKKPTDSNLSRFQYFRPAPPDFANTIACVLAAVWVPAGATSITASDLSDRRVKALQAESLADDFTTQTDLNNHTADADAHHSEPSAGSGIVDEATNQFGLDVVQSGSVTLSSGVATIDTGIATSTTATFNVYLGPATDDAELAADIVASSSSGNYEVQIQETDTSVGNPSCEYDITRLR